MLRALSGRTHVVATGVHALAIGVPGEAQREETIAVSSAVRFVTVSDERIAWYVSTGEPLDKAGAYAVQGKAAAFIRRIEGSYSGVMGLPLFETAEALAQIGFPVL